MNICIYIWVYMYIYIYTYTYKYIYIYIHIYINMHICMLCYICTHLSGSNSDCTAVRRPPYSNKWSTHNTYINIFVCVHVHTYVVSLTCIT